MSSVMTTARSVKERFLGSTAHWMAVGMVRRVSQHRRTDRCLGHPQRPRRLIWYLPRSATGPARPRPEAAGAGYSRRLASLQTTKLRTYASLRRDATSFELPGP